MAEPHRDKASVAVFISGIGTNMAALLYAGHQPESSYEVVLVASNDPEAEGLELARGEGIATFAKAHKGMDREEHDALLEQAAIDAGADYIALAGYMRILTPGFVARWKGRLLNIHPSLLPLYPGLETHARAIAVGDAKAGATVHLVTDELDMGEALGRAEVAIRPDDTPESLATRVRLAEHQLYPRVLSAYVSRASDPEWLLGEVRRRALALAEVEERPSHGAPGWRTQGKSGKYFSYFSALHHGSQAIALLVKTGGPDEQESLIAGDPEAFFKPAFYGASGWVGLVLDRPGLEWEQVDYWLERSWRAVAPKRLTHLLDAADEF